MRRMLPRLLAVMFAGVSPAASYGQGAPAEPDLIGDWTLPENGMVMQTYRCEDALCGRIVKVPNPALRDSYNPDPALRRRPLLGAVVATALDRTGPATWRGKVYNVLNGYTYNATLSLRDRNSLSFHGCLIGSLFCHTKIYYRVEPPSAPKRQPPAAPQRAVSRDRPAAVAAAKPKPARKAPTRADFEAFLKEREAFGDATTEAERQRLFKEFLAWRERPR